MQQMRRPRRRRRVDIDLGKRIREERERLQMTQAALAQKAGFKDLQTLSLIERGRRKIQMNDVILISGALGHDLVPDYYRLNKYHRPRVARLVSAVPQDHDILNQAVQRWEHRTLLETACDIRRTTRLPAVPDPPLASLDDASRFGDAIRDELFLGRCPAEVIVSVLERHGVLIEHREGITSSPLKGSGEFGKGLVVRGPKNSPQASYDSTKGLYDFLTWNQDQDEEKKTPEALSRSQDMAESFAATLLLPLKEFLSESKCWISRSGELTFIGLNGIAHFFNTTQSAVIWRFVTLDMLSASEAKQYLAMLDTETMPRLTNLDRIDFLAIRAVQLGRISEEQAKQYVVSPTTFGSYLTGPQGPSLRLHVPKGYN